MSATTTDTADREIVLSRLYNFPRELVWRAWTELEHVEHWWGPDGFTTTTHEHDVRPGGVWRFIMHGPDGRDYLNRVVYEEIVRPERLVYRHGGEGNDPMQFHVTVTFEDRDGQTMVTLRSVFATAEERNRVVEEHGAIEGGKQHLARLDAYLPAVAESPVVVRVSRTFSVSAERVFDAWLDPDSVSRWMFGPEVRDEEIVRITIDPRVGRSFSFVVRRQGAEINHIGTYLEIDRPRRLAFTWGVAGESDGESTVSIEIVSTDHGCELALTHSMEPKWAEYADRTNAAWRTMLDALARVEEAA